MNYYNENDPKAAAWLRELIKGGHIPAGDVDERSIVDVQPEDLEGYTQCHFFAGIGGWPLALAIAGISPDIPLWTGSAPCQPLSCAGKREGEMDERHLWPVWYSLIAERRPDAIYGEQTASGDGPEWLDGVSLDLEELGYAIGAGDLPAACVGAPDIRQRLWWVADAEGMHEPRPPQGVKCPGEIRGARPDAPTPPRRSGESRGLANSDSQRFQGQRLQLHQGAGRETDQVSEITGAGEACGVGSTQRSGLERHAGDGDNGSQPGRLDTLAAGSAASPGATNYWSDYELCWRRKAGGGGEWCRVEPGTFPLVAGLPDRVGLLRGYGNSINPWVAAKFIKAHVAARAEMALEKVQS